MKKHIINKIKSIETVREIKHISGKSYTYLIPQIMEIRKHGISIKTYGKKRMYLWTEERMDNYKNKIDLVKENTDWSDRKIDKKIAEAERYGIDINNFVRNQCWNFESTRQYKLLREIQYNEKQKRLKINKWYTKVIQEKRNCTKEEASEVMSLYKKKGFPNSTFILSGKYKDKIEDLKTMERYEKPATDCFVREKNEMYRRLIMDDTGWSET